MPRIAYNTVAALLTPDRLGPYLQAANNELASALSLYDWNIRAASALHADLARLEVIFRNAVDQALISYGNARGWQDPWYLQQHLFDSKKSAQARKSIQQAVVRATPAGGSHPVHGKVIAELNFGFWRYLCQSTYATKLWVPAVSTRFLGHPQSPDPHLVRAAVEDRMQRLHVLRNRIAHHEPIFRRDLRGEFDQLLELVGWICLDGRAWVQTTSNTLNALAARPRARMPRRLLQRCFSKLGRTRKRHRG